MTAKIRLLVPAAAELDEAIEWYRALAPSLETRFIEEVRLARRLIGERPAAWHPVGDGLRRFRLRRFPYGLIYAVEGEEIVIVAVAHLHREPTYWRERVAAHPAKP